MEAQPSLGPPSLVSFWLIDAGEWRCGTMVLALKDRQLPVLLCEPCLLSNLYGGPRRGLSGDIVDVLGLLLLFLLLLTAYCKLGVPCVVLMM